MKAEHPVARPTLLQALGALLLVAGLTVHAEQSANDMIVEHFFPPELLRQCAKVVALTTAQTNAIQPEIQKAQDHIAACQLLIRKEAQALVPLVKPEQVDEQKVLAASEKILSYEDEIKRAQLTLLIRIKNQLTSEQQTLLRQFVVRYNAIQEKLGRMQVLIQQWEMEGRDLQPLRQFKDEFEAFLKQGKLPEAEGVLDRTLARLESKEKK